MNGSGIEITIIYLDEHLIELAVSVSNGRFSGEANLYTGHDRLAKFADQLAGFPARAQDRREFDLGGDARFRFYCVDSLGHAGVNVDLQAVSYMTDDAERLSCFIALEAAAVDDFVEELRAMKLEVGETALLRGGDRWS